jgi:DNA-binding MarR family transcriptional regulator
MAMTDDPAREAWRLLFQLFRSSRREIAELHSDFDLNPAQVQLVLNVSPESGSPMNELAETLACDASYVTGLVDKLESRGLVQRTPKPEDRRIKLIGLTPQGREIRKRLYERVSQPPAFIAAMSPADQEALRDIFRRAAAHLPGADRTCAEKL